MRMKFCTQSSKHHFLTIFHGNMSGVLKLRAFYRATAFTKGEGPIKLDLSPTHLSTWLTRRQSVDVGQIRVVPLHFCGLPVIQPGERRLSMGLQWQANDPHLWHQTRAV
jgi:hypothetical protein